MITADGTKAVESRREATRRTSLSAASFFSLPTKLPLPSRSRSSMTRYAKSSSTFVASRIFALSPVKNSVIGHSGFVKRALLITCASSNAAANGMGASLSVERACKSCPNAISANELSVKRKKRADRSKSASRQSFSFPRASRG